MNQECFICRESKQLVYLACFHSICTTCLSKIKDTCPFCRHSLKEKTKEPENTILPPRVFPLPRYFLRRTLSIKRRFKRLGIYPEDNLITDNLSSDNI